MLFTNNRQFTFGILLVLSVLLLSSCRLSTPTSTPSPTPAATVAPLRTATPLPTPTQTPQPPLAVLLAPAGSDPDEASRLQSALNGPVIQAGLRWQVRPSLTARDLTPNLRLVVALPPDIGLADLAAAAPDTQFLAVGIPGLTPAPNLSQVAADGARPDQQGFLAGLIAAMITSDWRVGMIGLSDSDPDKAAHQGFLNGVTYFCGLCQQEYPPFYKYPLYIELPASASAAEWQATAEYMVGHQVLTVFIYPGAGDEAMLNYLAQKGTNLIGIGSPSEGLKPHWVASLYSDPLPAVQALLPDLLNGKGGAALPMPLEIREANPDLFSPGRQRLANEILADLLTGFVGTGVK